MEPQELREPVAERDQTDLLEENKAEDNFVIVKKQFLDKREGMIIIIIMSLYFLT